MLQIQLRAQLCSWHSQRGSHRLRLLRPALAGRGALTAHGFSGGSVNVRIRRGSKYSGDARTCVTRCSVEEPVEAKPEASSRHSVVALLDPNPYLSDGSKQAVANAAKSAKAESGKVTVVFLDAASLADADEKKRLDTVSWHFQQADFGNFEILEKQAENPSVVIGDVADEIKADLLIMSVESVHAKVVDANLLAEFVPCPILLLP